jgi:hypothetical protein
VHRDIKPSNLLVLKDGSIVLSDFGLARDENDYTITTTGEVVGSFGYVAPECKGHSAMPPFMCDVYALAKTAWVLISGERHPPQGELHSQKDSFSSKGIESESVDMSDLFALLQAAASRDLNDRPSADQFVRGLQSCTIESRNFRPVASKPVSVITRLRNQLGTEAERNKRDLERAELLQQLISFCEQCFSNSWKDFFVELGWAICPGSGGYMGKHIMQLKDGWHANRRIFFQGKVGTHSVNIALTFRTKDMPGEARLAVGATLAIQTGDRQENEYVVKELEHEFYIRGPEYKVVQADFASLIEQDEVRLRAIERLIELRDSK